MFFGLLFCSFGAQAQLISTSKPGGTTGNRELIQLLNADSLIIINDDVVELNRFVGNVRFQHKGSVMHCDLAIQNQLTNLIEAFGNVKLVQGDTVTVTGDTLYYYGDTRLAIVTGKKAVLQDAKRTLTTQRIEYDMNNSIAKYPLPGKTVDAQSTLTSLEGYYNTSTKEYFYYRDVKLVNEKYTLTTDTLIYNSLSKWSFFRGNTTIVNKDGTVQGTRGRYHTETEESIFETRTTVKDSLYTLT
jgi:lipopolysaccharide assembly outer membrane protein LptD (OstA)